MSIKAVFTDIDGTLLNPEGQLTDRARVVITECSRKGIPVVPATGRPYQAFPQFLKHVPGIRFAITSNGSSIFDVTTDERLYGVDIEIKTLKAVFEILKAREVLPEMFIAGRAFADERYLQGLDDMELSELSRKYIKASRTPVRDLFSFVESGFEQGQSIEGMAIAVTRPGLREELSSEFRKLEGLYQTSSAGHYLELADGRVSKAATAEKMLERWGFSCSEAAAFGDGINDLEMIRMAGTGVAMANGSEVLIAQADRVAPACSEDGFAVMLEELIRE